MERRLISERTKAGLKAAKARGRKGGRPTKITPKMLTVAKQMRADGETIATIAETLGVGATTVADHLKKQYPIL